MSTPVTSRPAPTAPPPARPPSAALVIAIVAGVAAVLTVIAFALFGDGLGRERPSFPSLAANPDPSLHGTVAYVDDRTRCIQLVAAAGAPSKQLYCLPPMDVAKNVALGKEQGPQLRWRSDGLLEVTMFRMTDPPGPTYNAGWQRLVDPRTGTVTEVANPPSKVDDSGEPRVNARGERILTSSDPKSGKIRVAIRYPDGSTRAVLSVQGSTNYTYGLASAFWSPDGSWIAADDGRILVITPGEKPVTRVLTDGTTMGGFEGPRFAVTATDLLTAGQS